MLKEFSEFEEQVSIAAFAAMDLKHALGNIDSNEFDKEFKRRAQNVQRDAFRLSKELAMNPLESAVLVRKVQQFGIPDAAQAYTLSAAGAKLELITGGEISADRAAEAIYRLGKATGRGVDESTLLADYLAIAAAESSGDPGQIERFARRFQVTAGAAGMTPEQAMAFVVAATDVDPGGRDYFSTAATRLLTKGLKRERAKVGRLLGMSASDFDQHLAANPAETLIGIPELLSVNAIADPVERAAKIAEVQSYNPNFEYDENRMRRLGLTPGTSFQEQVDKLGLDRNTRDILFFSTLRNSEKYRNAEEAFLKERSLFEGGQEDQLLINRQVDTMLNQSAASWRSFTGSMHRAAIVMGAALTTVFKPMLRVLTAMFDIIGDHPALAGSIAFGGLAYAVALGRRITTAIGGVSALAAGVGSAARLYPPTRMVAYGVPGMIDSTPIAGGRAALDNTPMIINAGRGGAIRAGGLAGRRAAARAALFGANVASAGRGKALGTTAGFGARALGFVGAGGLATRLAGSALGRAGLGALGMLSNPITAAILGISALAGPLTDLGTTLTKVGRDTGGVVGGIISWAGVLVKALGLLGNALNWLWDHSVGWIITKIGDIADTFGWNMPDALGAGTAESWIDSANAAMGKPGEPAASPSTAKTPATTRLKGATIYNNNIQVYNGEQDFEAGRTLDGLSTITGVRSTVS